jgi:hypothetical protein
MSWHRAHRLPTVKHPAPIRRPVFACPSTISPGLKGSMAVGADVVAWSDESSGEIDAEPLWCLHGPRTGNVAIVVPVQPGSEAPPEVNVDVIIRAPTAAGIQLKGDVSISSSGERAGPPSPVSHNHKYDDSLLFQVTQSDRTNVEWIWVSSPSRAVRE